MRIFELFLLNYVIQLTAVGPRLNGLFQNLFIINYKLETRISSFSFISLLPKLIPTAVVLEGEELCSIPFFPGQLEMDFQISPFPFHFWMQAWPSERLYWRRGDLGGYEPRGEVVKCSEQLPEVHWP